MTNGISQTFESIEIIKTTLAPIRLSNWHLTKLFAAELWRELLHSLASCYTSLAKTYAQSLESIAIIKSTLAPIRLSRLQLTKLLFAQIWRDASLFTRVITMMLTVTVLAILLDRLIRPKSLELLGLAIGGSSKGTKMNFQEMLEDCKTKVG